MSELSDNTRSGTLDAEGNLRMQPARPLNVAVIGAGVMGATIAATVLGEPVYDPTSEKPRTDG